MTPSTKRIILYYASGFKGIFDNLGIKVDVLSFAYKRLKGSYTGNCLRVRRSSDDEELDIGFLNDGNIDQSTLESFCSGTGGYIVKWYNQSSVGNDAYQNTANNQPKIVNSGSMIDSGPEFDGVNDLLHIDDYSAAQLITYPISIYANCYHVDSGGGYYIIKNTSSSTDVQYRLYRSSGFIKFGLGDTAVPCEQPISGQGTKSYKSLGVWQGTGANETKLNQDGNEVQGTFSSSVTNRQYITIGARRNAADYSFYFDGNIKTIIIFNSNQYSNYQNFVDGGI